MFNMWFKLGYRPRSGVISNSPPQNWHLSLICTKTNASCDLSLNVSSCGHLAKCAYLFSLTFLTRLKLFQFLRKIHKLHCIHKGNEFQPQVSFSNEKKRAVLGETSTCSQVFQRISKQPENGHKWKHSRHLFASMQVTETCSGNLKF